MPETITLPARRELVATARHAVRALLGPVPDEVADDAATIVSELFTNSILWSKSGDGRNVDIVVDHEPGTNVARIEVVDDGPSPGDEDAREDADQYGRGLLIVGKLAKLGHAASPRRQTWWAELAWS